MNENSIKATRKLRIYIERAQIVLETFALCTNVLESFPLPEDFLRCFWFHEIFCTKRKHSSEKELTFSRWLRPM